MDKDTYDPRVMLKLQIGHFLGTEHVHLIFSVDLASSLLLLV